MARYKMRQRMISIGEDFTIENESGDRVYEVDGKVLTMRETFEIRDRQGNEVATIRGKLLSLHDSMNILRGGDVIATVTKAWFTPLRDKFRIDVKNGQELVAQGGILDHEYTIRSGDDTVAQVSKRWFTLTDTYGIDVAAGQDDAMILAVAVAIDEMAHDPDEGRGK
jgi:uncharacterized protein YxjI